MTEPLDLSDIPSPLRLRLDGDALVHNWRTLDEMSGRAVAGAAVKANGYGLGAREVVTRLSAAGCRNFFVAHWREAAEIADLVPPASISVLNGVLPEEVSAARRIGAKPVINSLDQLATWQASGGGRCDLMFDSGMNRLGIEDHRAGEVAAMSLDVDTVMSHLASADEDVPQNAHQLARFQAVASHFPNARKSLANSAGIALGADYHFDLTRPGLALYGGIQREIFRGLIRQVDFVEALIVQKRELQAGEKVGYNGTFTARRDMTVAIVSMGYADGYSRAFSNGGKFRVGVEDATVVGRVSMDLTILASDKYASFGEARWATSVLNLSEAERLTKQSPYELLTRHNQMRGTRFWS